MTEQWPSHQIVGRPSFASAPWSHDRMQTLEDVQTWQGRKLVDADGDKIGTIEEILLDRQTGELAWAAVKTGLFGLEHTLVPIGDAEPVGDDEVRVHLDKETVKRAPRIDPGGELSAEDERRLWEHYGRSDDDDWQGEDRTRALGLPDEAQDRARESTACTESDAGAPQIISVRLRRVVVMATPVGGPEHTERGKATDRRLGRGALCPTRTQRSRRLHEAFYARYAERERRRLKADALARRTGSPHSEDQVPRGLPSGG